MPDTLVDTDILRAAVQLACRASIPGKSIVNGLNYIVCQHR
jgi:hypothetical protein